MAYARSKERTRIGRKRLEFNLSLSAAYAARMKGVVYFVSDGTGFVKIGCTSQEISARVASMQTSNPRRLVLIATIHTDNIAETEAAIHDEFHEHRHSIGEWFSITIDQIIECLATHGGSLE
jgi:hypothetical protein